jgi:hypothetical protein
MLTVLLLSGLLSVGETPTTDVVGLVEADRNRLIEYLTSSRRLLEDATNRLTPEQWRFKPDPGRWSVAECVEHLALAEQRIFGVVERALAAPEVPPAAPEVVLERDRMILRLATDRTQTFTAPEPLQPGGLAPEESLRLFHERRAATISFVRGVRQDLRRHAADHPLFKNADAYQWLLLAAAHVERHVRQIREIRSAPGFPG